jgi:hydroxyacylglutathione hydrolase
MRKLNKEGPAPLGTLAEPAALRPEDFEKSANSGAVILDCRSADAFAAHVPKSLNVGIGSSFPTWAGTVLPPNKPILLVLENPSDLWAVCWELLRIGYGVPAGWLAGGMFGWRTAGKPIEMMSQIDVWQLRERLQSGDDGLVLDVRQPKEWNSGHIAGAVHITGAELPKRIDEVPRDRPVATICGSGYRSSVAASLLQSAGFDDVTNVLGGMNAWQKAGMPTEAEANS